MTKRARRRLRSAPAGRPKLPPFAVRWLISTGFVAVAVVVSTIMEQFTRDRVIIIATALVVLFVMHMTLYRRAMDWYLVWAARRAAGRAEPASAEAPPPAARPAVPRRKVKPGSDRPG